MDDVKVFINGKIHCVVKFCGAVCRIPVPRLPDVNVKEETDPIVYQISNDFIECRFDGESYQGTSHDWHSYPDTLRPQQPPPWRKLSRD